MTTNVALVGAAGRMGLEVIDAIARDSDTTLTASIVEGSNFAAIEGADVVIDFSTPEACIAAADAAKRFGIPFVTGTTGLGAEQQAGVLALSDVVPVVQAANFSVGVNILLHLAELASQAADGFDIEIFEAHHSRKVDAPSGTALTLGHAAARGRGWTLDEVAVAAREGHTGPRPENQIGFQVARGGTVVGDHTVRLYGEQETIELGHRAQSRAIFADGAVRAARWVTAQTPNLYSMRDVLFGG